MRSFFVFVLCAFLFSCGQKPATIELVQKLPYADIKQESLVLALGDPEVKPFLLSGWGDPEKSGKNSFRWIVQNNAYLVLPVDQPKPMTLQIRAQSFFSNPADVLINDHLLQNIPITETNDLFTIAVPAADQVSGNNVLELRFAETRTPKGGTDNRQLAAELHSLSFSSRSDDNLEQDTLFSKGNINVSGKSTPAILCNRSGSLAFFENLDPSSTLEFGTYFRPGDLDTTNSVLFRVTLADQHGSDQVIFEKKYNAAASDSQQLKLAPFIKNQTLYRIRFEISKSNLDTVAWLNPKITVPAVKAVEEKSVTQRMNEIAKENSGANVFIVLLDAGAASHFSSYGYSRNTTPNADQLAHDGIQFESAYTQAVYTLASTASLMSGLYPFHHHVTSFDMKDRRRLSSDINTMAESFATAGYETATFVANGNASSTFGLTQGFRTVEQVFRDKHYSGWGKDITEKFTAWLQANRSKRMFAYLHYREPHAPFNPPPEWVNKYVDPNYTGLQNASFEVRQKINMGQIAATQADRDYIRALYDANLAYGDSQIGIIVEQLKKLGIYDNSIVIVTADHGEAFWEHGFQGHNSQLYQESARIPLIFKLAGKGQIKGETIQPIVRTIDLYPTLVDLMKFPSQQTKMDGQSYLKFIAGDKQNDRDVIIQNLGNNTFAIVDERYKYLLSLTYDRPSLFNLIHQTMPKDILVSEKFLVADLVMGDENAAQFLAHLRALGLASEELYDLQKDPGEHTNLAGRDSFLTSYYRSRLLGWFISTRVEAKRSERAVLDDSVRENLKALGYVNETETQK